MNVRSLRSLSFLFFRLAQTSLVRLQNKNARYRGQLFSFEEREGLPAVIPDWGKLQTK